MPGVLYHDRAEGQLSFSLATCIVERSSLFRSHPCFIIIYISPGRLSRIIPVGQDWFRHALLQRLVTQTIPVLPDADHDRRGAGP